jgi:trans-2,3-dihydro-3-hydroxyanthranilate isomerase
LNIYRIITLDAFTATPFEGNPCAILPEADGLTTDQMQSIARETNLPETAFVYRSDKADFRVRYFTPRHEVPFAGHPTIATAFMLAQEKMVKLQEPVTTVQLEFNIGVLPVEIRVENDEPVEAIMTQQLPVFGMQLTAAETAPCFNIAENDIRSDAPVQVVSTGAAFLLVPVTGVDVLGRLKMDREYLSVLLDKAGVGAAFVFSLGGFDPTADTHARMQDPKNAFEDPYTGSAAGGMGAYIVHYGLKQAGIMRAEQGHFVGRPGMGLLEITANGREITCVRLAGAAVKVMDGNLFLKS